MSLLIKVDMAVTGSRILKPDSERVSSANPPNRQGFPQLPVETRLGDSWSSAHPSAMSPIHDSREPVLLAVCVAEVLALLVERELNHPETETP